MDLINELSSDLALAVFVEKRHRQKIDSREARSLIARIESELLNSSLFGTQRPDRSTLENAIPIVSH